MRRGDFPFGDGKKKIWMERKKAGGKEAREEE